MLEFFITGLLGILLIGACALIIYEVLRLSWQFVPQLKHPPRLRVLLIVTAIFAGHIINIWLFGFVYYGLITAGVGSLSGTDIENGRFAVDIFGCIYFSAVTYTTLGIGDITPEGALRMITGVEGLVGFIMIGWTVTFTYLAMEKFWTLPHRKR